MNSAEAPVFTLNTVYPGTREIDLGFTLSQDGYVSCVARLPSQAEPTANEFSKKVQVKAALNSYFTIDSLEPTTEYNVYCFAENMRLPLQLALQNPKEQLPHLPRMTELSSLLEMEVLRSMRQPSPFWEVRLVRPGVSPAMAEVFPLVWRSRSPPRVFP